MMQGTIFSLLTIQVYKLVPPQNIEAENALKDVQEQKASQK